MVMKEQFVSYEHALKLKTLGFNENCIAWYYGKSLLTANINNLDKGFKVIDNTMDYALREDECSAPLWQQAFSWALNKVNTGIGFDEYILDIFNYSLSFKTVHSNNELCKGKEECLDKLIELITERVSKSTPTKSNKSDKDYFEDLEKYESQIYCNECGNDDRKTLIYQRTVSNGQCWCCKVCQHEFMTNDKPNEDDY